jgi:hypothetical protein
MEAFSNRHIALDPDLDGNVFNPFCRLSQVPALLAILVVRVQPVIKFDEQSRILTIKYGCVCCEYEIIAPPK